MNKSIADYKKQSVMTMSPGEQLVALLDEALKCLRAAVLLAKEEQYDPARVRAEKCRRIVDYLNGVLDHRYPIAGELAEIYRFLRSELVAFDMRADPARLEAVIPIVQTMRDAWSESERLVHMNKHR